MDIYVHCFFVLFIFIHVRFEGNNKYAKKVLSQPWNSLTLQISLSLREKHDKIVFTLIFLFFFNRAAMGRARFIIYPWFNFFFFLTARPWAERGS